MMSSRSHIRSSVLTASSQIRFARALIRMLVAWVAYGKRADLIAHEREPFKCRDRARRNRISDQRRPNSFIGAVCASATPARAVDAG